VKVQIKERDVTVSEVLRAHVESRLGIALGRFGDRIVRVTVRFSGANDRAGGQATRCQIDVGLRPQSVRAGDTDSDLFAAVDHATDRVSRAVARMLELENERSAT
jgi:ribosome hibernation promoting factor